jgi:hypothetical protein
MDANALAQTTCKGENNQSSRILGTQYFHHRQLALTVRFGFFETVIGVVVCGEERHVVSAFLQHARHRHHQLLSTTNPKVKMHDAHVQSLTMVRHHVRF